MSGESSFVIYKSNRLENFLPLVLPIIERLAKNAPLKKKSIVVQSDGMARWLTRKTASELGAFANFDFVSPDGFLRSFAEKYFGTGSEVYNKKNAEWLLYSQLSNTGTGPAGKYIGESAARAFRFSRTIADLFEQYFVYRPNMMECWQKGETRSKDPDELWQFEIFRKLSEKTKTRGFAQFFNEKCKNAPQNAGYPEELILFGISVENKYHLDMFMNLSRLFPVHLFAISPSREFYQKSKRKDGFQDPEENNGEIDTFFGRFCAASLDFLSFTLNNPVIERVCFEEPSENTLLSSIRKDILNDAEKPEEIALDDSVRIISCRDKMREIEVLKDNLLELFNSDKDLTPGNVAVMAPKINDYAPYITAVFGSSDPNDRTFIPYVISDRNFSGESKIAAAFLDILRLGRSDFEKSRVLSIFRSPCVCATFNADAEVVDGIEKLLDRSGVRWGLDAHSRGESCGGTGQNTWEFGLSRIMMSLLMPFSETGESFEGILPLESLSKEDFDNISGFITFVKGLFSYSKQLSAVNSPADFKNLLEEMLEFFFGTARSDRASAEEIRHIRSVIDDFAEMTGKCAVEPPFDALMQYLEEELGRERSGRGFLSAKVNFCSLKPLRAIPFDVIYLIGMGDGEFPRSENKYAFDLTQKKSLREADAPLPRSVRDNDKYLFVEAIISARKKLFISYEAKDLSEDSKKHRCAAMPVQILEKYIAKKTGIEAEKLETKYPVQPFSKEYFKGGEYRTFSRKDFETAKILAEGNGGREEEMFHVEQNASNPEPEQVSEQKTESCGSDEKEIVDLEKLVSFFRDPIKFYFTKILKIALPDDSKESGDEEIFDYSDDKLLEYNIRKIYTDMAQNMPEDFLHDPDALFLRRMKGEGKMPFGAFGEAELKEEVASEAWSRGISQLAAAELGFKDFLLDCADLPLKLEGRIQHIEWSRGRVLFLSPAKFKVKYKIEVLIRHLAANACGLDTDTRFFFNDEDGVLKKLPQKEAEGHLFWFLKLWLEKSRMPLFVPDLIDDIRKLFKKDSCPDESVVEKRVSSFFEDLWLQRNGDYPPFPEMVLCAEQFILCDESLMKEFPSTAVLKIAELLKIFFDRIKAEKNE